jgi:ABC-type multidrug transport system ATPase subunit
MEGRTTLIIAHRLSTISLADRVAVVEDGRVIAIGTHNELLATEPRYVEILAQAEAEEENPPDDDDDEDAVDERQIQHEIDVDVADSRMLDDAVGIESSPNTGGGAV